MSEQSKPVSIFMPESLIIQARVEAARLNMSRSAFVVEAVRRALREVATNDGVGQAGRIATKPRETGG